MGQGNSKIVDEYFLEFDWPLAFKTKDIKELLMDCGHLKAEASVRSFRTPLSICESRNVITLHISISFVPKTEGGTTVCAIFALLKNSAKTFLGATSMELSGFRKTYSVDYQVDRSALKRILIDVYKISDYTSLPSQILGQFFHRQKTLLFLPKSECQTEVSETIEAKEQKSQFLHSYGVDLFKSKKFSDVIINVQGNKFPAHRIILAAESPILENIFSVHVKKDVLQEVEIKNYNFKTVSEMIRFMYMGKKYRFEQDVCIKDLYTAADCYCVKKLLNLCKFELLSSLNEANALDVLLLAEVHNDHQLKKGVLLFICQNPSSVSNTTKCMAIVKERPELFKDILMCKRKQQV